MNSPSQATFLDQSGAHVFCFERRIPLFEIPHRGGGACYTKQKIVEKTCRLLDLHRNPNASILFLFFTFFRSVAPGIPISPAPLHQWANRGQHDVQKIPFLLLTAPCRRSTGGGSAEDAWAEERLHDLDRLGVDALVATGEVCAPLRQVTLRQIYPVLGARQKSLSSQPEELNGCLTPNMAWKAFVRPAGIIYLHVR